MISRYFHFLPFFLDNLPKKAPKSAFFGFKTFQNVFLTDTILLEYPIKNCLQKRPNAASFSRHAVRSKCLSNQKKHAII